MGLAPKTIKRSSTCLTIISAQNPNYTYVEKFKKKPNSVRRVYCNVHFSHKIQKIVTVKILLLMIYNVEYLQVI